MMKKIIKIIPLLLLLVFVSCELRDDGNRVAGITLEQTSTTLAIGDNLQLFAVLVPADVINPTVTWSSSNIDVATVSNTGVISAVADGTATITVTTQDGGHTATFVVTIDPDPDPDPDPTVSVTGITVSPTTVSLIVDETQQLTATVLPSNATNQNVTWSSSDNSVATVSGSGLVTAVFAGSATITVTTVDGGHTATCVVTVITPPISPTCNDNVPGWGASLGAVTRGTQEWPIQGTGANSHITQVWSDAVTATNCQKTTFDGGTADLSIPENSNFNADCRSNPDYPGDLFSWCAVVRFQDQLCPAPWRVPTRQDFIHLDLALGGNGNNRSFGTSNIATPRFVTDNYINRWGGAFGGHCNSVGSLVNQGWGNYWSQTENAAMGGRLLGFSTTGSIAPQDWAIKSGGRSLRCVR